MAERPTAFKPGQSGNPKGRPPKGRALTDLLQKALDKVTDGPDGGRIARKRLMADRVAEAVATGYVTLPGEDGKEKRVPMSVSEWRQMVQWLFAHVDGSKVLNEHTGEDGGPIRVIGWPEKGDDGTP